MEFRFKSGTKIGEGRFEIIRPLGSGGCAQVFEALDLSKNPHQKVAIKWLVPTTNDANEMLIREDFVKECLVLEKIHHPSIIKIFSIGKEHESLFIVLEYLRGGTLREKIATSAMLSTATVRLHPIEVVDIAIPILEALDIAHSHGIIHGDIKPNNIGFRRLEDLEPVLFDFGYSRFFTLDDNRPNQEAAASLPYMPPERIGFLSGTPKAASDLYSLGLTLYEIASGGRVNEGNNVNEICEQILCHVPRPLNEVVPDFPGPLAEIIEKLMRKEPDNRYSSARGLLEDIRRVRDDLAENQVKFFALGSRDIKREINYHVPMVGRSADMKRLSAFLDDAQQNMGTLALIGAPSGVGKSRMAREFLTDAAKRGFFVYRAKFTEFEQNIPLSAIERSLAYVQSHMNKMPNAEKELWQAHVRTRLGARGKLLLNKFPYLIADMPDFPDFGRVDPEIEEGIFLETLIDFFQVMFGVDKNVVIFLDDLQWADHLSVKLIKTLAMRLKHTNLGGSFFLGAFRSDEGENINTEVVPHLKDDQYIFLHNLREEESNTLVQLLLEECSPEVAKLQKITYNMTEGNAFFIYEFLNAALKNELFKMSATGSWYFDEKQTLQGNFADNLMDLVASRIKTLSPAAYELLCTASVVGNVVPYEFLKILLVKRWRRNNEGKTDEKILMYYNSYIHELKSHHLIWPDDKNFVFFHDRIRNSSYKTLDNQQRKYIHADYAEILKECYFRNKKEIDANFLFELAFHVQNGFPEENIKEARVILKLAGERALSLFTYHRAKGYLKASARLYPFDVEQLRQEKLLENFCDVQEALADALALSEEIRQAIQIYHFVLASISSVERRAAIYMKLSSNNLYLFQYPESIEAGRKGLEELGEKYFVNEWVAIIRIILGMPVMLCYLAWFKLFGKQYKRVKTKREELLWELKIGLQLPSFFTKPLTAIASHIPYTIKLMPYEDNRYRTMALVYWGVCTASLGIDRISRFCYNRGLEYFRNHYDPVIYAFTLFTLGYLGDFPRGRLKDAEARIKESLRITNNVGESFVRFLGYQGLIHIDYYGGNTHQADDAIANLVKMWHRVEFLPTILGCQLRLGIMKDTVVETENWISIVRKAGQDLNRQGFETIDTVYADLGPGECYLLLDNPARALPMLKNAFFSILKHFHRVSYCNYAPILLSQAYTRTGSPLKGLLALTAVAGNIIFGVRLFLPQTYFALGEIFFKLGLVRLGKKAILRGINIAKKADYSPVVAEGRLLLASYYIKSDPEYAEDQLLRARKFFEENGFHHFTKKCEDYLSEAKSAEIKQYPALAEDNTLSRITHKIRGHFEASALLEMFTKLSVLVDTKTLYQTALEAACTISGADHALFIVKGDEHWGVKEVKNVILQGNTVQNCSKDFDRKLFEQATLAKGNEPLVRNSAKIGESAKSVMIVPLQFQSRTSGFIYLGSHNISGLFDERTVKLVTSLGTQIAVSMQNFELFDKTKGLVSELEDREKTITGLNQELKKHIEHLDVLVEEKTREIKSILSNIRQGIFTITRDGTIGADYSPFLHDIIGKSEVAGQHVISAIFSKCNMTSDDLAILSSVLDSSLDSDRLGFEMNQHHLKTELVLKRAMDNREKIVEVDWSPIVDENDNIEKLLVAMRDMTEIRSLQQYAKEQEEAFVYLGELVNAGESEFDQYVKNGRRFLQDNMKTLQESTTCDMETAKKVFINLHTMKAQSRTLQFKKLTTEIHDAETKYAGIIHNREVFVKEVLIADMDNIMRTVNEMVVVSRIKLGWKEGSITVKAMEKVAIDSVGVRKNIVALEHLDLTSLADDGRRVISDIKRSLYSFAYRDASQVFSEALAVSEKLATELGKSKPVVEIRGNNYQIAADAVDTLKNVFAHIVSNSLDHGIETADERIRKNKPARGDIRIDLDEIHGKLRIKYSDDGRGLNLIKLKKLGIEKQMISEKTATTNAICNLIFLSGFTTREGVTHISGRGVGMEAVKAFLTKSGGSIDVVPTAKGDEDGHILFELHIWLPQDMYCKTEEQLEAA